MKIYVNVNVRFLTLFKCWHTGTSTGIITTCLMSMAWCKTAVTPLLTHWSYCSLAPSHRCVICRWVHSLQRLFFLFHQRIHEIHTTYRLWKFHYIFFKHGTVCKNSQKVTLRMCVINVVQSPQQLISNTHTAFDSTTQNISLYLLHKKYNQRKTITKTHRRSMSVFIQIRLYTN